MSVPESSPYLDSPASTFPVGAIAEAWERELPGVPTTSIPVVTPIWRLAKLFDDDRRRVLRELGIDAATLDLLSVLRRSGPPYRVTTRRLAAASLVSAGAVSQRVARAEREGLVVRAASTDSRRAVAVTLTTKGHDLIERAVERVLREEARLVASLSARDRKQLGTLLARLTDDVRAIV